ncbi:MAG TPA: hypothetical protein VFD06_03520, partial [Candidatus Polarisedimenticolia bacterium]|nr:hypothetical protein [Candidatus Polarisedimenticolia bacterium]
MPAVGLLLAVVILLILSFVRIAPGERAFRVSGDGAQPLAPGMHLRFPGRIVRLAAGTISVRGEVPLRSSEGAALAATYEVSAGVPDAAVAKVLAQAPGPGDLEGSLRRAAVAGVEKWAQGRSGEAIALGEGRAAAEDAIRRRLGEEGYDPVQVRIAGAPGSSEMQAKLAAQAVRQRSEATGLKVAILGLDGADWEIL